MQTRSCDLVGKEITVVMDAANWWTGIMVEILLKNKFQKSFTLRAYFFVCVQTLWNFVPQLLVTLSAC